MAALKERKDLLPRLRGAVADGAGIEVPRLAEVKRVSWTNLVFAVGSLIGIWAIIGVLSGAGGALDAIKGASWGWVALAFILAQLPRFRYVARDGQLLPVVIVLDQHRLERLLLCRHHKLPWLRFWGSPIGQGLWLKFGLSLTAASSSRPAPTRQLVLIWFLEL